MRWPRQHSCCTGYSLRATRSDHGWKKPVIASLHQLGPLQSPKNRLCVCQDLGLGIQLYSCAGKSIPVRHGEANAGTGTSKDRDRRGWCYCVASDGCFFYCSEQGRVGWEELRPALGLRGLQVFCSFSWGRRLHQGRV